MYAPKKEQFVIIWQIKETMLPPLPPPVKEIIRKTHKEKMKKNEEKSESLNELIDFRRVLFWLETLVH